MPVTSRAYDRDAVAARVAAREATDQFRSLPATVQDEYRARWREEIERQVAREESRGARREHGAVSGALLFLAVTVIWDGPTLLTVPASLVIGATTGLLWDLFGVGRFGALALTLPGYVLLRMMGPELPPFAMFFGFVGMAAFATLLGALREVNIGGVDPRRLFARRRPASAPAPAAKPTTPAAPTKQEGSSSCGVGAPLT